MPGSPDRYVIVEHSSHGEYVEHGPPYWTEAEATDRAQQWSRDAEQSGTPIRHSVHKLSKALWEG